jgi:hypothetical protein
MTDDYYYTMAVYSQACRSAFHVMRLVPAAAAAFLGLDEKDGVRDE